MQHKLVVKAMTLAFVSGISVLTLFSGTQILKQVSVASDNGLGETYAINGTSKLSSPRSFFASQNFTSNIVESQRNRNENDPTNNVVSAEQKASKKGNENPRRKPPNNSSTLSAAEKFKLIPTTWNVSSRHGTLSTSTKILGFVTRGYILNGLLWYRRLEALGYTTHELVAVDSDAAAAFEKAGFRYSKLKYPLSVTNKALEDFPQLIVKYRRELFARRWYHIYELLLNNETNNYSYLLTDVDNIWNRHLPLETLEKSDFDMFLAYSNAYPQDIFYQQGFTVCGGMGWFRNSVRVKETIAGLLRWCKCQIESPTIRAKQCFCDDQVTLNSMFHPEVNYSGVVIDPWHVPTIMWRHMRHVSLSSPKNP